MEWTCDTLRAAYDWNRHAFFFEKFFVHGVLDDSWTVDLPNLSCPNDKDFYRDTPFLTVEACEKIVGCSWRPYPAKDILKRLTNWKAPLLQLVLLFPRPPLGIKVEFFTILHLLGDPIDTILSLLYTLEVCQSRAESLQKQGMPDQDWKVLTLIMVSYDECGNNEAAAELENLYQSWNVEESSSPRLVPDCCQEKARALAADRSTTLVPVICAQFIFIGTLALSYARTFTDQSGPGNWWIIEIHSIAFSLTVLWVTVAVLLGSLIGVTQSEQAIARILHRLGDHTQGECAIAHGSRRRRDSFWNKSSPLEMRIHNGAIPSWRPDKWSSHKLPGLVDEQLGIRTSSAKASASKSMPSMCAFSLLIVSSGTIAAFTLSGLVPPEGFGARAAAQAVQLAIWIASFLIECAVAQLGIAERMHFWVVFSKDLVSASCNITLTVLIIWGILNRCSAWSLWNHTGVILGSIKQISDIVSKRSKGVYPVIIFLGIIIHFVYCGVIARRYTHALRVYLQRDDGKSHLRGARQTFLGSHGGYQNIGDPGEAMESGTRLTPPMAHMSPGLRTRRFQ